MFGIRFQLVVALCAAAMAMSLANLSTNQTHTQNVSASIGSLDHASTNWTSLSAPIDEAEPSTPNDAIVEIRAASHKHGDHHDKGKHGHRKKKHPKPVHHGHDEESQYKHWRGVKKFKHKKLSPWLDPSFGTLRQRIDASIKAGPPEDRFKQALKRVRTVYRQSFPPHRRGLKCHLFYRPICDLIQSFKHPSKNSVKYSVVGGVRHTQCRCV